MQKVEATFHIEEDGTIAKNWFLSPSSLLFIPGRKKVLHFHLFCIRNRSSLYVVFLFFLSQTKMYFGTRENPAQIPSLDNRKSTVTQSLNITTDPIEADYVAEVKRFQEMQENKKSLLEQLLQEPSIQ